MISAADPTLHALTAAAVHATGAASGWLLRNLGASGLGVVATTGPQAAAIGTIVPADSGVTGFVIGSGQPMSISPTSSDRSLDGDIATLAGTTPRSLLCVPCANDDDILGVLALTDKHTGGSFTIDDVEIAVLLAGVAGVALGHQDTRPRTPDPVVLARRLDQLARIDPDRYRTVATLVEALLAG